MKSTAILEGNKAKIAAVTNSPVKGVFQYNIKHADGVEKWVLDLNLSKFSQGTTASPDVTFDVSDDDYFLMNTGALSHKDAIAAGRFIVSGDVELANKLFSLSDR